jgi:alpha-1,3/alpha-1,6-mannosyltransferase
LRRTRELTLDSNTRVKRFVSYAEAVSTFQDIIKETPKPNTYTNLKALNQEETTTIALAADLCIMLTKGLTKSRGVDKQLGRVSGASWSDVRVFSPLYLND